jgi:hypothetical protein
MLPPDAAGYFWDLNVRREGGELKIIDGKSIASVPKPKAAQNEAICWQKR